MNHKIAFALTSFDIMSVKETMRKSVLTDILNVLLIIRRQYKIEEIESFVLKALSGEILDKKTKKQIEARMGGV